MDYGRGFPETGHNVWWFCTDYTYIQYGKRTITYCAHSRNVSKQAHTVPCCKFVPCVDMIFCQVFFLQKYL